MIYSASLLLLFDPFSILSAGFWLSYGACFILLRIYQTIAQLSQDQLFNMDTKIFLAAKALIESQSKIFVALLPLVLIFFQQVSWVAPLSNLIAIPVLSAVVVPLTFLLRVFGSPFQFLGKFLFQLNDFVLSLLLWMLDTLQQIAPQLYGVSYTPLMMLMFILGLIIYLRQEGRFRKLGLRFVFYRYYLV